MCVVSMVYDYYHNRPGLIPSPNGTSPWGAPTIPTPPVWTKDTFEDLKKALEILESLDERLGQPDCEDPAKAAWMREVEERLKALEVPQE